MRFGSLFAGIGGFDLGLERAGLTCAWQVEVDPYARNVLQRHWPEVPKRGDIRLCDATNLAPVDLLCGGFPCQDISVAGKGVGVEAGHRSGLWREYARLVRELRPRWVIVENVPGLRTRGADVVLGDLESAGYACWPLVVGARHVGAPHRRDRVWIVARLGNPEYGGQRGGQQFAPGATTGWAGLVDGERKRRTSEGRGRVGSVEGAQPASGGLADARGGRFVRPGAGQDQFTGRAEAVGAGSDPRGVFHAACAGLEGARQGRAPESGGVADGDGDGLRDESGRGGGTNGTGATVPGTAGDGLAHGHGHGHGCERERAADGGGGPQRDEPDGCDQRRRWPSRPGEPQHEWEAPRVVEPRMGRAAHGVSRRLALKALGNAVVPACAEAIGRAILAMEAGG